MNKEEKSLYDKLYYQRNKEKRKIQGKIYYQENKEKTNQRNRDNYWKNIEKERERHKAKYLSNPDRYKRYWRERRARQLSVIGGHYTEKQFKKLCDSLGNKCLCCGATAITLEADHVIPLGPPHSDEISNIQPLCGTCNKKKARKYIDYRNEMKNFAFSGGDEWDTR